MKQTNTTRIAILETIATNMKEKVKTFVTIDRFNPIEKIVWVTTVLIITSVVGAGLTLVLK